MHEESVKVEAEPERMILTAMVEVKGTHAKRAEHVLSALSSQCTA